MRDADTVCARKTCRVFKLVWANYILNDINSIIMKCVQCVLYVLWREGVSKGENGCWKIYLVWEVEGSWLPPGHEAAGPAAGCAASGLPAWYPFFPAFCLSISSELALNRRKKKQGWRIKGQKEREASGNSICTAGDTLKGYRWSIYVGGRREWGNAHKQIWSEVYSCTNCALYVDERVFQGRNTVSDIKTNCF